MRFVLFALPLFPVSAFAVTPAYPERGELPVGSRPPRSAGVCPARDLHQAVRSRSLLCVEQALSRMDINDRDVDGNPPLHNAIHAGNIPAVRLLLRAGADLHLRDFEGRNAIDLAWVRGLHRLHYELQETERETERLLEAVDYNDVAAASNSLSRGASLGLRDVRLDTPLHRAAQSGLVEVGRLLIHHGARLEARNYLGETPLHSAALRDHRGFVALLLDAGANPNAINERRQTALDLAGIRADPEILALLGKAGARGGSPASVEFDLTGGDGLGPSMAPPAR